MNINKYRYRGAYIELTNPDIYFNVFDLDFTSLYPSVISKFNIDPATFVTEFYGCMRVENKVIPVDQEEPEFGFPLYIFDSGMNPFYRSEPLFVINSFEELRQFLKSRNIIMVPNPSGICWFYRKEPVGVLPSIIREIFTRRKEERKLFKETGNMEHHFRQWALKIMMNSMYGIFGNRSVYMGCLPIAESVTAAGRMSIRTVISQIRDRFIYSHTDSIFVKAFTDDPVVEAGELQERLNSFINDYMENNFNAREDFKLELKQEFVFKSILIKEINRYFAVTVDGKEEMKGIEVINSSVPEIVKKYFRGYLKYISQPDIDVISATIEFYNNFVSQKNFWSIEDLYHKMKISSSDSAERYVGCVEEVMKMKKENVPISEIFIKMYDHTLPIHYKGALFASIIGCKPPQMGDKIYWFYCTMLDPSRTNPPLSLEEVNPEHGSGVWNILKAGKKTHINRLRNIHALSIREDDEEGLEIVKKYIDRDKYCQIISEKTIDLLKSLGYVENTTKIKTVEDLIRFLVESEN